MTDTHLPVAVIGAGPVGLAAAAHLVSRGIEPLIFEAGDAVGASVREWGHVRVFSPWELQHRPGRRRVARRDRLVARRPATATRRATRSSTRYLEPLAALPAIAPRCASARA